VRVFPGIDPALVSGALRTGVRGLVLEAYGTGNLPHLAGSLIPALEEARERGVPVLVVSQCLRGVVDMTAYAGGAAAKAAGAISGGDMTVEAAIAKLMIGLGRFDDDAALRRWLQADVVGERVPVA
jgi:L-asparaginase